jgi:hypothetical protein
MNKLEIKKLEHPNLGNPADIIADEHKERRKLHIEKILDIE